MEAQLFRNGPVALDDIRIMLRPLYKAREPFQEVRAGQRHSYSGKKVRCIVCEGPADLIPTDTTSVVVCSTCGAPYQFVFGTSKIGLKTVFKDEWIEPTKRYWNETQRNVAPGTNDDAKEFLDNWMIAHAGSLPTDFLGWRRGHDIRFLPLL